MCLVGSREEGAHLGAPDSALGVHPGIGDGGHLDEEQGPQAAVGGRVGRQLQAALQADFPKLPALLLLMAQSTPARPSSSAPASSICISCSTLIPHKAHITLCQLGPRPSATVL